MIKFKDLLKSLTISWSKETCYNFDIYKCNGISHYFNKENNNIVDLTKEQFNIKEIDYSDAKKVTREEILSNEDTLLRYKILKQKVEKNLLLK